MIIIKNFFKNNDNLCTFILITKILKMEIHTMLNKLFFILRWF
jgi:hypothetical protein